MKRILIVDDESVGMNSLLHQMMQEKHGDDIILVTPEEAKERGLKMEDFANIPEMKITAPPIRDISGIVKSGKENRRERRERERNSAKKRK